MSKRSKGGNVGCILKTTKGITTGTVINCCDNSGVKSIKVISVKGNGAKLNRYASASVGGVIVGAVKKGKEDQLGKVIRAVIVRQRQTINRKGSSRIKFEDNAGVMITDKNEVKATGITGPVAKECLERFPKIGSIAQCVV